MTNPYAAFDMNPDKEKSGVYFEGGPFRVKVARAGGKNIKYDNIREALTKPHRRAIQTDTLPKEIQDALNAELAVKALVTSWEVDVAFGQSDPVSGAALPQTWASNKIHDPDTGEVVDYTQDIAIATFLKYNDLYLGIARWAGDAENYLNKEAIEADVGN